MTINSRAKGATYERDVVAYFKDNGRPHMERRLGGMAADKGDLNGIPGVVIECKNRKDFDLAGYMAQLEQEIATAGAETGVVIIKRRGVTDVGQHYALLPVARWAELLLESGR